MDGAEVDLLALVQEHGGAQVRRSHVEPVPHPLHLPAQETGEPAPGGEVHPQGAESELIVHRE